MGGITNQAVYEQISTLINQSAGEVIQGTFGAIGRAGLLLMTAFTGQSGMGAEQQLYLGLATLLLWLITVWLLRDILAGGRPKLRDGLYNAGAPIVGMAVIVFIAVVQLIPVGLVALAYSALAGVGILKEGMGMFLFWIFAVSVITLVLYWMTTTFLALVIVMLPGMYPLRAMRAAGDLVVDRRLRILYRLLWGCLVALLGWALCMITVILLDTGIKNILPVLKYIPFVPLIASLVGTIMFVWMSAYVYLLYRRIVDDGASPA